MCLTAALSHQIAFSSYHTSHNRLLIPRSEGGVNEPVHLPPPPPLPHSNLTRRYLTYKVVIAFLNKLERTHSHDGR